MSDELLRNAFQNEIESVRDQIVQMCAMTTESIPLVTEVLLDLDLDAAQKLVEDDDNVDMLSVSVEEQCYSMLALQQPMATDLRSILATLWINSEVERSADLVVNIAKGARRMYGTKFSPRLRGVIVQMSVEAQRLFRLATDAYVDRNAGLASALDEIDDRLDELQYESIAAIFQAHSAGEFDLQSAIQMALITRYYERIGDHAVNIGERVRYMVDGWMPEHAGAERVRMKLAAADEALVANDPELGPVFAVEAVEEFADVVNAESDDVE